MPDDVDPLEVALDAATHCLFGNSDSCEAVQDTLRAIDGFLAALPRRSAVTVAGRRYHIASFRRELRVIEKIMLEKRPSTVVLEDVDLEPVEPEQSHAAVTVGDGETAKPGNL